MSLTKGVLLGACAAVAWCGEARAQSLSTSADGNQSRFNVVPSVRTVYDSNVLRRNDSDDDPQDNVRVTPGLDVLLRRTVGRVAVNAEGTFGYDFNSRFRFLNRTRVGVNGRVVGPIKGLCQGTLVGRYDQYQFDLGDVDGVVGATTRQQYYDASLGCALTGISPSVGVTYTNSSTGARQFFDSNSVTVRGGLNYSRPSLGTASLTLSRGRLERPGVASLIGSDDDTVTTQVQLSLTRNVAPRLGFAAGIGYVHADPTRGGVSGYSAPSFNAQVTWRPVPRFTVDGGAQRQITNQTGFNATYVVREDYQLGVSWQLSAASRVRLGAARVDRDFRGRQALPLASVIGSDQTDTLTAAYSIDTARLLRITFAASQRWRDADVSFYDFSSTTFSASIGAKF